MYPFTDSQKVGDRQNPMGGKKKVKLEHKTVWKRPKCARGRANRWGMLLMCPVFHCVHKWVNECLHACEHKYIFSWDDEAQCICYLSPVGGWSIHTYCISLTLCSVTNSHMHVITDMSPAWTLHPEWMKSHMQVMLLKLPLSFDLFSSGVLTINKPFLAKIS